MKCPLLLSLVVGGLLTGVAPVWGQETPPPAEPPKENVPVVPISKTGDQSIESSSPVPSNSVLYPGSTVKQFRGKDNFGFLTELDFRYRVANRDKAGIYQNDLALHALRITTDWVRANPLNRDERGGVRVQLVAEPDPEKTPLKRVRLSESYAYYTFLSGGVSARLRVGQFVLPFGLIAIYDTPLDPIQPLYEKSLGLRVDTGAMLEGRYGEFKYAGSVTTGAGPSQTDLHEHRHGIVSFRLARTVQTEIGDFEVGGSLLTGWLPQTSFNTLLPASGYTGKTERVKATRFAGDGQYTRGPIRLRGEVVFGGNRDEPVFGYFAEGNYQFTKRFHAVAYSKRWDFPTKPERTNTLGAGADYLVTSQFLLRAMLEYQRDRPKDDNAFIIKRITVQGRIAF